MQQLIRMLEKLFKISLLFLIVIDLGYSFCQFYHQKFDGDLIPIIAPSKHYQTILDNPFGEKILLEKTPYAGSSRYFSHKSLQLYFKNVPIWFQIWLSPVDSLYASAALIKLLVQFSLIFILTIYICRHLQFWRVDFLGIFLLISPFFQTNGYFNNMGIIDSSVTYLFFYALPIMALLLFLLPFYLTYFGKNSNYFPWWVKFGWLFLLIMLPFSGALIAPLGIMICGFIFLALVTKSAPNTIFSHQIRKNIALIKPVFWCYFSLFFLICIYSYWLSTFNLENNGTLPYHESFAALLNGLFFILTSKIGIPLLLILIGLNYFLLKKPKFHHSKFKPNHQRAFKKLLLFLWLFLLLYLLILPLGGVRDYRPNIIRHDTFIPVTIGLIFTIGIGANTIVKTLKHNIKHAYITILFIIGIFFSIADNPHFDNNDCEKSVLQNLAISKNETFYLSTNCTLFSWNAKESPAHLNLTSKMLHLWNITDKQVILVRKKQ